MLSERAQFGAFALTSYVILKVAESILYRFSAIGDTSPLGNLLNACVSMTYGWIPDCLPPSRISFQKRIDAEDHEGGKRRGVFTLSGRMDAENVAELKATVWFRSERRSHRHGLEGPNPGGSRGCQVPRALRSGQHQDQELPGIHSRVDHQRATTGFNGKSTNTIVVALRSALTVGKRV
jgi:hypothetical protein